MVQLSIATVLATRCWNRK